MINVLVTKSSYIKFVNSDSLSIDDALLSHNCIVTLILKKLEHKCHLGAICHGICGTNECTYNNH